MYSLERAPRDINSDVTDDNIVTGRRRKRAPADFYMESYATIEPPLPKGIISDERQELLVGNGPVQSGSSDGRQNLLIPDGRQKSSIEDDRDDTLAVLSVFAVGLSTPREYDRYHWDDLPPEPRNWKEMLNHPFSEGFLTVCGLEITNLGKKGTF